MTPRQRRWTLTAIPFAALAACAGLVVFWPSGSHYQPRSLPVRAPSVTPSLRTTTSPGATPKVYPKTAPTELVIQSLGLDSKAMQPEGVCQTVNPNGDPACAALNVIQTPPLSGPDARDVGWWTGSLQTGRPQVFVAHVNSAAAGNLTFWNLSKIQVGALIVVQPNNQKYWVTAIQEVNKNSFPTHPVYDTTSVPELRLITCGGTFNQSTGHYEDNFIVYATAVAP